MSAPGRPTILDAGAPYCRGVANNLVQWARESLRQRGGFHLALTGGRTPLPVYALLGSPAYREELPWERVHFYWSDERHVPPDHPESNYRMAWETWLAPLEVADDRIHRLAGERRDLDGAARQYEQTLSELIPRCECGIPVFDLILLGMGGDGHTASLFPGTSAIDEGVRWVVSNTVPQLSTQRLTFTFPLINRRGPCGCWSRGPRRRRALPKSGSGPCPCPVSGCNRWLENCDGSSTGQPRRNYRRGIIDSRTSREIVPAGENRSPARYSGRSSPRSRGSPVDRRPRSLTGAAPRPTP